MKTIKLLTITFTIFIFGFSIDKPLIIKPGKSIGELCLNKTTFSEVKAKLGKGKIIKYKWYAPHCGKAYDRCILKYADKGISFVFNVKKIKRNDVFVSVKLTSGFNSQTDKQIKTGYSSRSDIYNAYGKPYFEDNKSIDYDNLGISFKIELKKKEKLETLTSIEIYKPLNRK